MQLASSHFGPVGLALLVLVLALAPGCVGEANSGRWFTSDATVPVERGLEDAGSPIDQGLAPDAPRMPDRCSPLPERCLCPAACQQGKCDNARCPCAAIPGQIYGRVGPVPPYNGDAAEHADYNLYLRKWREVPGDKGLVHYDGPTDTAPGPQLYTLFGDGRVPQFTRLFQIDDWNWGCDCSGGFASEGKVNLAGMRVAPGEVIHLPQSGYTIMPPDFAGQVLYAAPGTITVHYTAADSVAIGYTLHIFGICVEPSLLALYRQLDAAGRAELPGLRPQQPLGRAINSEIIVAIRDSGSWMDPRARKDWWQGK